jgi:hypothetical protein
MQTLLKQQLLLLLMLCCSAQSPFQPVHIARDFCLWITKKGKFSLVLLHGYFLFIQMPTSTTAMIMAIPMRYLAFCAWF